MLFIQVLFYLPLAKIMELTHLGFLAVNKLITDKTEKHFYLIAERPGFIKYTLNKAN